MSRSGYTDDADGPELALWRGAVSRALKGKRGQQALREIRDALDAMPEKVLIGESLVTADGEYCTLGALGAARGLDMTKIDPEDWDAVAGMFGIAPAMVREIVYENDEAVDDYDFVEVQIVGPVRPYYPEYGRHTVTRRVPLQHVEQKRWAHMRAWVEKHIDASQEHPAC